MPAREFGPSDCWLSRNSSIAGCCSTASSMSANRPSTCGRIASRSNAPARMRTLPALARRDAEMIGPERHQPLDEAGLGQRRALEARQRLGAIGLDDHVDRLRRFGRGGFRRPDRVWLLRLGLSGGSPASAAGICACASAGRLRTLRCRQRAAAAPRLDKREERLAEFGRRPQRRLLEQRRVRPGQLRLDETARVGGCAGEIPGRSRRVPRNRSGSGRPSAPCGSRANCVSCFRRIRQQSSGQHNKIGQDQYCSGSRPTSN